MEIPSRGTILEALAGRTFDLLVIGGGITGCGVARDAVLRGLSVALVEKDDFASGTSSRSSRLIHGGVRYLEHGQLHLVLEASSERRHLLALAPHLVRPLPFVWPVYRGARVPRWKLAAGLTLYDGLAFFHNVRSHRRLSAEGIRTAEPALLSEGLRGGALYYDAKTDDARLTLANAIGALEGGAIAANHVVVEALGRGADGVPSTVVVDRIGGRRIDVRSHIVVNAAGPWSDRIHRLESGQARAAVRGSKGVHIAVPRARVNNRNAVTLLDPDDRRVMFALPAGSFTILGTTDSYTSESPDEVRATEEDLAYLLTAANTFFPGARLGRGDVVAAWAGIRPLVATGATSVGASREHAITLTPGGVITITGGKLTTYRVMAKDVVDAVLRALGQRHRETTTDRIPLPGGDFPSLDALEKTAVEATKDSPLGIHLVAAHGSRWTDVWREIESSPDGGMRIDPAVPYTLGELRFAVRREQARTIADLLFRRTRFAFESYDHGRAAAPAVARAIAPLLDWGEPEVQRAIGEYAREVDRVFTIEP